MSRYFSKGDGSYFGNGKVSSWSDESSVTLAEFHSRRQQIVYGHDGGNSQPRWRQQLTEAVAAIDRGGYRNRLWMSASVEELEVIDRVGDGSVFFFCSNAFPATKLEKDTWQVVAHLIDQTHKSDSKSPTFATTKLENSNPHLKRVVI
ncbi:unnamed protein product [Trifolium pratense]|uniref:Uncharacterized protein n=1 Tax=Trifolium pratense TaxID=57577 RepID=A0ACB0J4M8_TRIPR|nr:unnamed protein product [Trifolium pratense]